MKIKHTNVKKCDLHLSLRYLLRQYRWSGFFPVEGLEQSDPSKIRYRWKSLYTLYYIASFMWHILVTTFSFFWFVRRSMTLGSLSNLLFFGTVLSGTLLSIKLAKNWPKLISEAAETEESLAEIRTTKNISMKCNVIAHVVMFLALVEHILCQLFNMDIIMSCMGETTLNQRVIKKYFQFKNYVIFQYIPYNPIIGVLAEFSCLQATFIWSFVDVLIMLFSTYITSCFNDLNDAINSYQKQDMIPWSRLRVHYSRIVVLLKHIDSQINSFLMVSFFSNLFFICFQLFNTLHWSSFEIGFCHAVGSNPSKSPSVYLLYYLFSFSFLVLRSLILSILTANVHVAAQGPLLALYEVPTSAYNIEVQRFQLQLRCTTIGLSGLFFYVTRKTILRVIGTVITYELVLLEFSRNVTDHHKFSVSSGED